MLTQNDSRTTCKCIAFITNKVYIDYDEYEKKDKLF